MRITSHVSPMDHLDDIPANSMIGRRVGVYELVEEVGRGGMGVIFRAHRVDGEFDQTVAVKLIKRGMDTDLILKRFRRERQITAQLNHPNIAYFFGGGSTNDGLPYFVMEFIVGKPLYQFCDENRLNIRERLNIFRQICWAVQAAHDLKIIHRDLKPSNVMVKDDGKPKLLDFGIAKVLDPDLMGTADIAPTATQLRVMTPEYAAPEQISGEEISEATDIYSLGVILYELLTGHRPYTLGRRMGEEAARVIREELPTSPSGSLTRDDSLLALNGDEVSLDYVLNARNASLETLRRELSGDLDRIVLKTLRKKPQERYRSAAELADDISNYLEDRPVNAEFFTTLSGISRSALPDSLSIAILPFKMVGAGAGDTGDEFLGIGLADALISRLSGVQRLVVRPTSSVLPFSESDAFEAGQYLGVDYILDGNIRVAGDRIRVSVQLLNVGEQSIRWAKAFDEHLTDVLELEDSLAGSVTGALLPHLSGEERRRLERRGTSKPEAYQAYLRGRYFWSRFTDAYLEKAVEAFEEAIEIDPDYALPYIGLADYYMWSAIFGEIPSREGFTKAADAARRALEIDDLLGEAYAALAYAVFVIGWNWEEAENLVKRALELSPNYSFAHECYSNFLVAQGRFDEGIAEIRRAEALDPVSPKAILMTAWSLYQARRYEESVEKARKAVAMQHDFPQGLLHLGNSLAGAGELEEAVAVLRESAEMWGDSGLPRYLLCHARAKQGNMAAARKILDKLLKTEERMHVKPYFIAMCFTAVGDFDKACEWFQRAIDEQNEWMIWFGTDPKLDDLRRDARYRFLLEQTNNPIARSGFAAGRTETGDRERSIAVLPFKRIHSHDTGDSGDEYLSIGLADSLTMRLSNVRRFLVRPTSSVLPFANRDVDPFTAGRELGVEFVVDGIIRRIGDRIRVTAQLLNVNENSTRWSASFAERFTDVLELEDSISEQVTKQLVPKLTGEEQLQLAKRGTSIPEAHDAYLQGRYFWSQFEPQSFPKAIEAFRRAVAADENYALAYVGIADYFTWACIYGLVPPSEGFPHVLKYASRALEIDPNLAEAHAALGLYYSNIQQWDRSEASYRRALELNPTYPLAHEWLSAILVATGRFEEGKKEIFLAESLDPLSLRPKVLSAWTIYQTRDYDAALVKALELEHLNANFMQTHLQLCNILQETGRPDQALIHGRRAVEMAPDSPLPVYCLCFALASNGLLNEAEELIAHWEARVGEMYVPPYFLGMAHLAVGRIDSTFNYLEKARAERSAWALWLGTEPKLDPIREDARYQELMKRVGLPYTPPKEKRAAS